MKHRTGKIKREITNSLNEQRTYLIQQIPMIYFSIDNAIVFICHENIIIYAHTASGKYLKIHFFKFIV